MSGIAVALHSGARADHRERSLIPMNPPEASPAADRRSQSKWLLMGMPVLVLLAAGGAGWWWSVAPRLAAAEAAPARRTDTGLVSFDPFVVNLADPGGRRFLRVSLKLVAAGKAAMQELKDDEMQRSRVRSEILELLATYSSEKLVTPDGKTQLKQAVAERATRIVPHMEVVDVLFAEFVVQ
jgi:flagellar protein FliL